MPEDQYERFKHLTFARFQQLASDDSLSRYEKIGFPNSYREGKEAVIFRDIERKLANLSKTDQIVLDIGPGCSDLPRMMVELCRSRKHALLLVDSPEMLRHLPDDGGSIKVAGRFPRDCADLIDEYEGTVNVILSYSVLHYVFAEASVFEFVDSAMKLLAEGGEMLIGDIPNVSKRKRFFSSPEGVRFHQQFTGSGEVPAVLFNQIETGEIDDSVIFSLLHRSRSAGCDAYVLPQGPDLPMANRREDILIRKP